MGLAPALVRAVGVVGCVWLVQLLPCHLLGLHHDAATPLGPLQQHAPLHLQLDALPVTRKAKELLTIGPDVVVHPPDYDP